MSHKIGSFVKYRGNQDVTGVLRNSGVGRIDNLEDFNGKQRIYLFLLDERQQHIWCDWKDIESIWLEKKHFEQLNFKPVYNNHENSWILGDIRISRMGFVAQFNYRNLWFLTGWCLIDFYSVPLEINDYFKDGDFDAALFYKTFNSVHDINDFFDCLDNNGIAYTKEEISLL